MTEGAQSLDSDSPFRFLADGASNAIKKHSGPMSNILVNDWLTMSIQRAATTSKAMPKAAWRFWPQWTGTPTAKSTAEFEYYIIRSAAVTINVAQRHQMWLSDHSKVGSVGQDSNVRTIQIPPAVSYSGRRIDDYKNRWDIIERPLEHKCLAATLTLLAQAAPNSHAK